VNRESDAGERIAKALLDERNCEMCNVDSDPLTIKFLRGMNRGSAPTKWIED
jgi:hypothetical protein